MIRALSVDGETLWLSTIAGTGDPVNTAYVVKQGGDGFGGVLAQLETQQGSTWSSSIARFDGASGQESWRYISTGLLDYDWAVRSDGTVFVVEKDNSSGDSALVGIDGRTGIASMRIPIAPSYFEIDWPTGPQIEHYHSFTGVPMVAPDGAVNIEGYFLSDISGGPTTSVDRKLSLLTVSPNGGYVWQALEHYGLSWSAGQGPGHITDYNAGAVIPDGQDGLLAAWTQTSADTAFYVTHVSAGATSKYTLPMNGPWYSPVSMVLGENGTAFAAQSGKFVSFNIASGAVNWTWTGGSGTAEMIAASAGNGLVVRDGTHVTRIDPTGAATPDAWSGNSIDYVIGDLWLAVGGSEARSAAEVPRPKSSYSKAYQDSRNAPDPIINVEVHSVLDPQVPGNHPPLVPDTSVGDQVNEAIAYWQLNAGIILRWDGVIDHVVACDAQSHPNDCGYPNFNYTYFVSDPQMTPFSTQLLEVFRRFCGVPNVAPLDNSHPRSYCQPTGSQLLFTNTLPPNADAGSTPNVLDQDINLSLISASALGLDVAHEFGHQFQLPDCSQVGSGLSACGITNLMYFIGHAGGILSGPQALRAKAWAHRWVTRVP